ncbi:MATE family efflux transporter [Novosphingopyxis sp.]|uniref:MATE family efflux transporter n=1 Tax=Novosphingopyxis sp. TaxID=2709690 RepID=UPI003B5AD244
MTETGKLTRGPVRYHLFHQTWPALIGVAALMSIGIVDAYFVGREGADQLAAISFIFPIVTALSSLGVGVIVGINSVVSRALGRGEHDLAETRGLQGFVIAGFAGVAIGLLLWLFQGDLFAAMNAGGDLEPLITAYMTPYALGFPFVMAMMSLSGMLRGQGAAMRSSIILIVNAAANWVLDPMLIAGWGPLPGYGIAGAAYASVIAFGLAGITAFALLQSSDLKLRLSRFSRAGWGEGARALIRVGGPAAISNSINPIGLAVLTGFLATYGKDAVAGYGAAGRLQSFAVVPLLALSGSIGAIVGQNWGAGQEGRARKALLYAVGFAVLYGLAVAALLVGFASDFAGLFTDSQPVIDAAAQYLAIAAWGYGLYGALIVSNGALNAIDRAGQALMVSVGRVLLVMVPAAWLLGRLWREGGVFAAELAANLVGGSIAFWIAWKVLKDGVNAQRARSHEAGAPSEVQPAE